LPHRDREERRSRPTRGALTLLVRLAGVIRRWTVAHTGAARRCGAFVDRHSVALNDALCPATASDRAQSRTGTFRRASPVRTDEVARAVPPASDGRSILEGHLAVAAALAHDVAVDAGRQRTVARSRAARRAVGAAAAAARRLTIARARAAGAAIEVALVLRIAVVSDSVGRHNSHRGVPRTAVGHAGPERTAAAALTTARGAGTGAITGAVRVEEALGLAGSAAHRDRSCEKDHALPEQGDVCRSHRSSPVPKIPEGSSSVKRRCVYTRSMMPAAPMPVPTHIVTIPYFLLVRRSAWTTVAARMAPVAPRG
jgi:hypothetical protein